MSINLTVEQFGIKIGLARLAAGRISREELARRVADTGYNNGSCTAKTIQRWEDGNIKHVNLDMIQSLAKATNQTEAYFLGQEPLRENINFKVYNIDDSLSPISSNNPLNALQVLGSLT